jgi:hypothetical protein
VLPIRFFHPDFPLPWVTVGQGITPCLRVKNPLADFLRKKVVVFLLHNTAGEEFHPALKQMYLIVV